jgi:serine/threonine protein kinase
MNTNLKNGLEKYGFIINDDFLKKINNRDELYIYNIISNMPVFIEYKIEGFKKINTVIKYMDLIKSEDTKFILEKYISEGTFNKSFIVKDINNNKLFAYRILKEPIINESDKVENFIEYFIQAFLNVYYENNKHNRILKLDKIGYSIKNNSISSINDLMNGTLYYILINNKIEHKIKLSILVKVINIIIKLLIDLQKNFNFTHNDLKSDNIFFKFKNDNLEDLYDVNNLSFFIGDFDSSILKIDEYYIGNNYYNENYTFNKKKDLFLLINSLFFSFNSDIWKETFFNNFKLVDNIVDNDGTFHSLYSYNDDKIDDMYDPINFRKLFDSYYGNIYSTKYKIDYQ